MHDNRNHAPQRDRALKTKMAYDARQFIYSEIAMNEPKKLMFQLNVPVRWADMDVNAHVNNTRFFTYFEAARIAWLESVRARTTRDGQGPVVVQATCNYKRPIPYPETLDIRVFGGVPRRSSFTTYYNIFSAADESICYADGLAVMVWVNRATGKSLPIPDFLRDVLAQGDAASVV